MLDNLKKSEIQGSRTWKELNIETILRESFVGWAFICFFFFSKVSLFPRTLIFNLLLNLLLVSK